MNMQICVLRDMTPDEVRAKLRAFTNSYVLDWENWLRVAESDRVAKFASVLRSWNATRPQPMRRPRADATHEPPYIEDLLDEAAPHLQVIGDLTLASLAPAIPAQINALHGLWAVFTRLPQQKLASCVGITKAIMLLTNGRIGPAFDSIVRKKLGLKRHLKSSDEWIGVLRGIGEDIHAFEERHGNLADIVPERFARYQTGRLYDMLLGPATSTPLAVTDPPVKLVIPATDQA
jgi:hypothetical protein